MRTPLLIVALAGVASLGCGGDSLVLPSQGLAARIDIMKGDGQSGTVGSALKDSLVVSVVDATGRPVTGAKIAFVPVAGAQGAQVAPDTISTDSAGLAQSRWQLGTVAGSQVVEARVVGQALNASFGATALPAPASVIAVVAGQGQSGVAGQPLRDSLVVQVADRYGNLVSGANVNWATGSGKLSPARTSSANGLAAAQWTLGGGAGNQNASAVLSNGNGSTSFVATATPPPSPQLVIAVQPSDSTPSGVDFVRQPVVQLQDASGNPLPIGGVAVTVALASGGGTLGGATTQNTNSSGAAAFRNLAILGPSGPHTLIFAASGYTAAISAPIEVTAQPPSAARSTLVVSTNVAVAGTGSITVTVTALDSNDQPVPGVPVVLGVSGSGNTISQPPITDVRGEAVGSFSSTVAEQKVISARVGGTLIATTRSVAIVPGPPDPSTTTASVPNGHSFRTTVITIQARDLFGNQLHTGGAAASFSVQVTGANSGPAQVSDNRDGTYTAIYFALFRGTDQIAITLNGIPIQGSPYTSRVR
jgi:hypothetical protein